MRLIGSFQTVFISVDGFQAIELEKCKQDLQKLKNHISDEMSKLHVQTPTLAKRDIPLYPKVGFLTNLMNGFMLFIYHRLLMSSDIISARTFLPNDHDQLTPSASPPPSF